MPGSHWYYQQRRYLGYDLPEYRARLEKTISRYGLPTDKRSWARDIDYRAWDHLWYMQPSSALWWQCYLQQAITDASLPGRPDLATITVLDHRWHFGEKHWDFNPGKIEYQVRRALKGLNYLVLIEFEIFRNDQYLGPPLPGSVASHSSHGRVIAPHIQGIIWGKRPNRKQRAEFAGGLFGAPAIKIVHVHDFTGALQYMVKPPQGRSVSNREASHVLRWPWHDISLTLHHLLLTHLHAFSYPDLTFAGGEGRAILAHAKRLWRDYQPAAAGICVTRPPLEAGLVKRPRS